MGRGHQKRHRRRNFVTLHALQEGEKNIKSLVRETRNLGSSQAQREKRMKEVDVAASRAMTDAENVTELFLMRVPPDISAPDLVLILLRTLYVRQLVSIHDVNVHHDSRGQTGNSPILRCEIRRNKRGNSSNAFVLVRTAELAQTIVQSSPLPLHDGRSLSVLTSKRLSVPNLGSAWRTSRDPGSVRWKIAALHVGEKLSEEVFSSFWASSPFYDLTENSHVELNPVASVLAVTIGRPLLVLKARTTSTGSRNDFTSSYSMLRVEFPFRSICDTPRAEKNYRSTEGYAVYFPIAKSPRLFRAAEDGQSDGRKQMTWDCLGGSSQETRWVRTVDPTPTAAFSRARGVRITMSSEVMYSLFKQLYQHCLVDVSRPVVATTKSHAEGSSPDRNAMLQEAARKYGISFRVRYLVDSILSLGTVRIAAVDNLFWEALATEMTEEEAMVVLDFMLFRLASNDAFTKIIDPLEMLRSCMKMVNVRTKPSAVPGALQSAEEFSDTESDSGASIGTENTEDFVMDNYVRELRLEELSINDDPNSVAPFETKPLPGALSTKKPSRQHAYIRRLIFTPTKTIVQRPECDLLNRVLREFAQHKDRFLRVSFADEDGGSIGHAGSDDLYARVRAALRDGIFAAGEKFVFLAFSNSQLRDHAVWMYNESPDAVSVTPTADEIRKWMGDFSSIRVPGKYAARQGQVFSSTVGALVLEDFQEGYIDDVIDHSGQYVFSDGVGLMSYDLAREVAKRLRLHPGTRVPSAFQVRYGGVKGMLTVWDTAMPRRRNVEIALRPSMKKFESTHRALEIVGFSKRLPFFLNRQIIILLSGFGVPDEAFEKMQGSLLHQLDRAMESDGASHALDLLFSSGCFDSEVKLRATAPMHNAGAFFRAGLTCVSCEHLFNIMHAFRKRMIRDLMLRARIPVGSNSGFCALGVMDELGVLTANQIFCQYTVPGSSKTRVVTGPVTVGRNPCLHPGDIQPVHAIDHPSLRHLVDVIVFPRLGARPLPSMLSGGDLDGDIFFCLFDPLVAYPSKEPAQAMNYSAPAPRTLPHDVSTSDVTDFFVEYIRNDRLGQIANAHVVFADKERQGIFSEKCIKLAELHSVAVDFAKTGVPAQLHRDLQPRNEAKQYPDFMGKHAKVSYKSNRILGKLYRACVESRSVKGREFASFPNPSSMQIDEVIDSFPSDEDLEVEAESICEGYNVEIARLIDQFGVRDEAEVVSGQVLSFSARHAQIRGRREHYALVMRLNRQANELRTRFREEFFHGLGQHAGGEYNTDTIVKACAWYRACAKVAEEDRQAGRTPLVSFPWVVSDVLLQVIGNSLEGSMCGSMNGRV